MFNNQTLNGQYKANPSRSGMKEIVDLDKKGKAPNSFIATRLEAITETFVSKYPTIRQTPHLIAFIQKGSGDEIIGDRSFSIRDNMLFIVPSRMPFSCDLGGSELKGFITCFTDDAFLNKSISARLIRNKSVLNGNSSPFIILNNHQASQMELIMEQLIFEYGDRSRSVDSNEMISVKLLELLILCERFFNFGNPQTPASPVPKVILAFRQMVEQDFKTFRSVNYYAKKLFLHPNTLNAYSQAYCGVSAKSFINKRLMNEAKYLLGDSGLSVKEIAWELGFEDTNYFSYFFRNESGFSPLEYKHSLKCIA